eukprot:6212576-Pleurochrysis_carterae.AAC.1
MSCAQRARPSLDASKVIDAPPGWSKSVAPTSPADGSGVAERARLPAPATLFDSIFFALPAVPEPR